MKFSKIYIGSVLAAIAISAVSASGQYDVNQNGAYNYNGQRNINTNTNYNSQQQNGNQYQHSNNNVNYDDTNSNYNRAGANNAHSGGQRYAMNANCYGCNRAYPPTQAEANQYNNNNRPSTSPYGTQKVLPAIYGGNGLFNYKGYARVPERVPRPGYGLSLRPIRTLALSAPSAYPDQARPHQPRPVYHQQRALLARHRVQYPRRQPDVPRRHRARRAQRRPMGLLGHPPPHRHRVGQHGPNCNHHRGRRAPRPTRQYGAGTPTAAAPSRPVAHQYTDNYKQPKNGSYQKAQISGGY